MYKSILLIAALGSILSFTNVQAGQFIPLSVDQLTTRSAIVLQGSVLSKTCLRDESGRIYTRIEVSVSDVWKGNVASNRFTIVQGGGTLGEERVTVSGQAEFQPGEEIVAFLVLNQRGEGVTLGLRQGKFDVQNDKITGEKYAHNLFHGRPAIERPQRTPPAPAAAGRLGLSELKRRVQEARQ